MIAGIRHIFFQAKYGKRDRRPKPLAFYAASDASFLADPKARGAENALSKPLEICSVRRTSPGMSVCVTKEFARFARKARVADVKLLQAARDVAAGHYDADLGGGVFKQRIAREGGGKSGGFRTIILFRVGSHSFFGHGFAKSDKANVSAQELKALKRLADVLLGFSKAQLEAALAAGELIKVQNDGDVKEKD